MINGKTVLAIIPARGGSKGVPKKNILSIGGKPLIAWTIQAAKNATFIDRLILSSDCQEIIQTALKYGCEVPFVRPDELATDQAGSAAVVSHALASLKESYDYVVLLQPTSIFRSAEVFSWLQVFVSEDTLPYDMPKRCSLDIDAEENVMLAKYSQSSHDYKANSYNVCKE